MFKGAMVELLYNQRLRRSTKRRIIIYLTSVEEILKSVHPVVSISFTLYVINFILCGY